MFGLVDKLRARLMRDDSQRVETPAGRVGGTVKTLGASYEPARRYQAHPDRILAMRSALVCPPVYVALGMWRDLMRVPTPRVEPGKVGDAEPTANAIAYADHVKACLGIGEASPAGVQWSSLWGELLGSVEYGFGVWETVAEQHGGEWYTVLKYRDPASVAWWILGDDEELAGCMQRPVSGLGGGVEIPASQLFRLTWRPVSRSDYSGIGILRPAATLAVDHAAAAQLRIVGVQRFAVGTPVAKVDAETAARLGPQAVKDADDIAGMLADYTSSDRAFLVPPPGWDVSIFGADYDVSRINAVLADISRSIYELVAMQWMLLGSGEGGGSYSLGETQVEASRQSAQAVCDWLGNELTAGLFPRIVKWRFGDVDPRELPTMHFDGLASEAFVKHLAVLASLHQAGILQIGPESRAKVHAALELAPPEEKRPVGLGLRPQTPAAPAMPTPTGGA